MADVPISCRGGGNRTQTMLARPSASRRGARPVSVPSYSALVELWHGPLYCCAACLAGSLAAAGPLTEKAFRRWQQAGIGELSPGKQRRRLFGALYHEFAGTAPERETVEPVLIAAAGPGALALEALERVRQLEPRQLIAAFGHVDGRGRTPLAFSYAGGFSAIEIAELMNLPLQSVLTRLADGKTQLAQALVPTASTPASQPPAAV